MRRRLGTRLPALFPEWDWSEPSLDCAHGERSQHCHASRNDGGLVPRSTPVLPHAYGVKEDIEQTSLPRNLKSPNSPPIHRHCLSRPRWCTTRMTDVVLDRESSSLYSLSCQKCSHRPPPDLALRSWCGGISTVNADQLYTTRTGSDRILRNCSGY